MFADNIFPQHRSQCRPPIAPTRKRRLSGAFHWMSKRWPSGVICSPSKIGPAIASMVKCRTDVRHRLVQSALHRQAVDCGKDRRGVAPLLNTVGFSPRDSAKRYLKIAICGARTGTGFGVYKCSRQIKITILKFQLHRSHMSD